MKKITSIFGVMILLIGTLFPYSLYTLSEGKGNSIELYLIIFIVAIISFVAFLISHVITSIKILQFIIGTTLSYFFMGIALLIATKITGDYDETIMWFPIIILFGVPYMAPLVLCAFISKVLIINKIRNSNEIASPNGETAGANSP